MAIIVSHGHYIFTDSDPPRKPGDSSRLISTLIPATGVSNCFNFRYNMHGTDVGSLNVYLKNGSASSLVWTLSGDQGTGWKLGSFPIPGTSGTGNTYQIIMEAKTGKGNKGDIALDDLEVVSLTCSISPSSAGPNSQKSTTLTTASTASTGPPSNPNTVTCNFDGGLCGWTQLTTDNKDWIRHQGTTNSYGTGPSSDHTGRNGYYLYLESSTGQFGDAARIVSGTIQPRASVECLTFWYHMQGSSIGSLSIYIYHITSIGSPLWTRSGSQGNVWIKGSLSISRQSSYRLVIEAKKGTSYTGDIAIDDIMLVDGYCADATSTASGVTSLPSPGSVINSCDFEDGSKMCNYTNDAANTQQYSWRLTSHTSGSYATGPNNDHTYGTIMGKNFFYLEF
ncbi:MAM and LDL-receptor class A domain-containing protein 1-like [Aplysia californica]|uniref:MAM and LDL-receptor class A domain-containing protein 1-like n=1 Tax=Aplysia californica TaxID=6500 RepID=A0ABM1VYX1_APLCA|nr:MAM and LDL-receptor class A domain-containing protein 1-like [Aplysia californica]